MRKFTFIVALLGVLFLAGCNAEQIAEVRQEIAEKQVHIEKAEQVLDAALERQHHLDQLLPLVPEKDRQKVLEAKEKVVDIAQHTADFIDNEKVAVAELVKHLDGAQDQWDVGKAVGSAVSTLPLPWAAPVGMGIAALSGLLGQIFGKRKGMEKVAGAIEVAKGSRKELNFDDPDLRRKLDLLLGKDGKAAVDRVQGKRA